MDEISLTFDLSLTRTVNKKCEASVTLKTTGQERTLFTCVFGCTASGLIKRITMGKEKLPKDMVVNVNKKGRMVERLMNECLKGCYGKQPRAFFSQKKSLTSFGQHEGLHYRFRERSRKDDKLHFSSYSGGGGAQQSICSLLTSV